MSVPDEAYTNKAVVTVIGRGPVGLIAAIALATAGVPTALIGRPSGGADNRTTALLAGSVAALDTLGVWSACAAHAAPLRILRIVDDTGRLMRAPEVKFDAAEIDLDAFGHNIENRHLLAVLEERARSLPALRLIDAQVATVEPDNNAVGIHLANGETVETSLTIGADGRNSLCRNAAGIEVVTHAYPQSALTLSFEHTRPHHNISTEFHTPAGPFTQVPLPGLRSSLVWVLEPGDVDQIAALDDGALSLRIEHGLHSILGKVRVLPRRGVFPLSRATVRHFAANRIALVGEAAHVTPPIGAQGLNLGIRDAMALADLVAGVFRDGGDPGSATPLDQYDELRRADVGSRSLAVDLLNRSLLSDFLPVHSARGAGLYLIDKIGPLRRAIMREGVASVPDRGRSALTGVFRRR